MRQPSDKYDIPWWGFVMLIFTLPIIPFIWAYVVIEQAVQKLKRETM